MTLTVTTSCPGIAPGDCPDRSPMRLPIPRDINGREKLNGCA